MSIDEQIEVLQALKVGKEIEYIFRLSSCMGWQLELHANQGLNFTVCDYRVKPEPPKPIDLWVHRSAVREIKPYQSGYIHVREVIDEPC